MDRVRIATLVLMGAAFLTFFDRALLPPMLTAIAADWDVSVEVIGNSLTAHVIAYAAAQLAWSSVSGRIGQIRVLRISMSIAVVGLLATAVAFEPIGFTIARAISGAAIGATVPATLVFLGDSIPVARRGIAMANLATSLSTGMAVGTVVAAIAGPAGWWRAPFFGAAAAAVVLVVSLFRLDPGPVPTRPVPVVRAVLRMVRDRWAVFTLLLAVLEGILLIGAISFLPVALHSVGVDPTIAGLVTALFGVSVIASSQVVKRVVVRTRPFVLLLAGGLATVVGYAMLTTVLAVWTVVVSCILFGFAWASAHTQLQTWMTDVLAENRPVGMALFATGLFAGGAIGAALGTLATAADAYPVLFLGTTVGAVLFTLGTVLGRIRYTERES